MGRRRGSSSIINAIVKSAAQHQKNYNAEIRRQNNALKLRLKEQKNHERDMAILQKEEAVQFAVDKTNEAEQQRNELVSLLQKSDLNPITFKWETIKRHDKFIASKPMKPKLADIPPEINPNCYNPKISIVDKLFKKRMEDKQNNAKSAYEKAITSREEHLKKIQEDNAKTLADFGVELDIWNKDRDTFIKKQNEYNDSIDQLKENYNNKDDDAVEFYFNQVISLINLPETIYPEWELEYNSETGILIIDMVLPTKDVIPTLKSMKYVATRREFTNTEIKEKDVDAIFDKMILQLCLLITHYVCISDKDNLLEMVVFNGIYNGINKSTGEEESKYILSLNTKKEEFLKIVIHNVEARACFISLKGISGARLTELIPIAPFITMNRDDRRFVQGVNVASTIEGQNLASMDWESFEHLIRELFEKEFAVNGAEVRITQASRDGGVDAVMFDPDPIRGGKYIIQAKRYTNVVGVSAVRDLYGTLSHEGAVKGILVTTADYGADSHEFAKNKPLTLINGSNLLFLLQKHGYNARIDLEEAKRLNLLGK